MTLKRYLFAGLSLSAFSLAACTESIEDIEASANELEELHNNVVTELNTLHESESELQEAFDETLAEDEDLTSLTEGTSPVFENLESRSDSLDNISEIELEIEEHSQTLNEYEGEMLPEEELETIANDVDEFLDALNEYSNQYTTTLDTQEDYFLMIADDDATYDSFADGIEDVNEEYFVLQELIVDLDNELTEFEEAVSQLNSLVEEAAEEEGE